MRLPAGSHGVGKALDAELLPFTVPRARNGRQTNGVIPAGTAPSLAARVRRKPKSAVAPGTTVGPSRRSGKTRLRFPIRLGQSFVFLGSPTIIIRNSQVF